MKKQQALSGFFVLEILIYSICLILFLGLLATVGINTLLSHVLLSSSGEASYMQRFTTFTGILFWSATVLLLLFVTSCNTLFRCIPAVSLSKKPVSKIAFLTTFIRTFFRQLSFVIVLVVLGWAGGQVVINNLYTTLTGSLMPVVQQTEFYENRAEYYQKEEPFEFSPKASLKES